ncbi:hypothetical protein G6O67_000910 [Ophiocordyceps sinensis]|nr:hypothetical protein G6O67_000910 [Ophiocordyceps sinensis]
MSRLLSGQTRLLSASLLARRPASTMRQPRLSSGTDADAVAPALAALLAPGGRWTLAADGQALERSFKFKTFAKTWDFMTAVSLQCKVRNHHPEWSNVYNTTFVRWTTHDPPGLSEKDMGMAAACDAIAKDFGELEPEAPSGVARELAGRMTAAAGDCCTPKQ